MYAFEWIWSMLLSWNIVITSVKNPVASSFFPPSPVISNDMCKLWSKQLVGISFIENSVTISIRVGDAFAIKIAHLIKYLLSSDFGTSVLGVTIGDIVVASVVSCLNITFDWTFKANSKNKFVKKKVYFHLKYILLAFKI